MCDKDTLSKFRQIFDEYCNLPDSVGSQKTLVSKIIKFLLLVLMKLLVTVVTKTLEER